jgi:hypothetical protein
MRSFLGAICVAVGVLSGCAIAGAGPAVAQNKPAEEAVDALAQMQLTEAQVKQYIAAQTDFAAVMAQAPQDSDTKPDAQFMAKLDAVAKKYKFANYDEFDVVAGNIALVLEGVDPKTKKYIGAAAALKQQIAEVQSNSKLSAADKKEALEQLNGEMNSITPIKFPGNIELVLKYYDQFSNEQQN